VRTRSIVIEAVFGQGPIRLSFVSGDSNDLIITLICWSQSPKRAFGTRKGLGQDLLSTTGRRDGNLVIPFPPFLDGEARSSRLNASKVLWCERVERYTTDCLTKKKMLDAPGEILQ